MDDAEDEDSLDYAEIEITDLDPPQRSNLASAVWRYSERHRLRVRVVKAVFMCLGVLILAVAALPPWLAQLSSSSPAISRQTSTFSSLSTACIQSIQQNVITSPGQSTSSTSITFSVNGETLVAPTPVNPQDKAGGACIQVTAFAIPSSVNSILHQDRVQVKFVHRLSGGGFIIQWYRVR